MITVSVCLDETLIQDVMTQMFLDIAEDGLSESLCKPDMNSQQWVLVKDCGESVALFSFTAYNRTTCQIHPYVFYGKRKKAVEYGKAAMKWFKESAPSIYKKLMTDAADCFPHCQRYAKQCGFTEEGHMKNCFTRGKIYGIKIYGINRGEI